MSNNIKPHNEFEYHLEDIDCAYCLHYIRKRKSQERGCDREECCCEDICADAIANGRITRDRGWNK